MATGKGFWSGKNVMIGVLICLFGLAVGNTIYQRHVLMVEKEKEVAKYILQDSVLQKENKRLKDKGGRELSNWALQQNTYKSLLLSRSKEIEALKRDLNAVGGNLKDVAYYTSVKMTTRDTILIPVHDTLPLATSVTDTGIKAIPFAWKDDWLAINGAANFRALDSLGWEVQSVSFQYDLKNSISETHYWKGGFLKKRSLQLLITNDNPHTTVNKVQTYSIMAERKWYEKWWVHAIVGAGAGYYLHSRLK